MRPVGATLGRYLSTRFLRAIVAVFLFLAALVFILDFIEMLRRAADVREASAASLALASAMRTPSILEQTVPFIVLFAALIAFLALSRRLEFVVMRAAGLSAWQFLAPPVLMAVLVGAFAAAAFNPLAAILKSRADTIETAIFGGRSSDTGSNGPRWIRQRSDDGQAIIRAASATDRGTRLSGVTVFLFDPEGRFSGRIAATTATLGDGLWRLTDARFFRPDREPTEPAPYDLKTALTPAQVQQSFGNARTVPFWGLPETIALARSAGLDASQYQLQYQVMLARPALLVAMVLIAASVSLRLFRSGGVIPLVLGGIAAGFVLYVVIKIAEDLGTAGLVAPPVAAWAPVMLAMLAGFGLILKQEDG